MDEAAFYPLLDDDSATQRGNSTSAKPACSGIPHSPSTTSLSETASLPTIIKEKDVEYQVGKRIIRYENDLNFFSLIVI